MVIKINNNIEGKIGIQIDELIVIYGRICEKEYPTITLDFQCVMFVNTTFVLGLAVIITELEKTGKKVNWINCNNTILDYFDAICFPNGLMPDKVLNWSIILENSAKKTYLPIVNFSTSLNGEETKLRNEIISHFTKLLALKFNFDISAISYFISEFTDNVVEHSGEDRGWLFYQFFPQKDYVEISIIDSGRTILGSFKKGGFNQIKNDKDAINNAMTGLSTKSPERGRGLRTSTNLIFKGLLGNMFLTSGEAMYIMPPSGKSVILQCNKWKGTILSIKIPKDIPKELDIYKFIN